MERDPKRIWIIEVTEEKLFDLMQDSEDIHRFLAGQMELWNATCYIPDHKRRKELREALNKLQSLVTPNLVFGGSYDWCGNGCENEYHKKKIARGYATYRNLRHCVEMYRNNPGFNILKSPTLTCEDGGELAICYPKEILEAGNNKK